MLSLVKNLTHLGHSLLSVREAAAIELAEFQYCSESAEVATNFVTVMFNSQRWEDRFGAIVASAILAKKAKEYTWQYLSKFVMEEKIPKLILDTEFRVRS